VKSHYPHQVRKRSHFGTGYCKTGICFPMPAWFFFLDRSTYPQEAITHYELVVFRVHQRCKHTRAAILLWNARYANEKNYTGSEAQIVWTSHLNLMPKKTHTRFTKKRPSKITHTTLCYWTQVFVVCLIVCVSMACLVCPLVLESFLKKYTDPDLCWQSWQSVFIVYTDPNQCWQRWYTLIQICADRVDRVFSYHVH